MQKGNGDVHLPSLPTTRSNDREHRANCGRFHHQRERLLEIHSWSLRESTNDPSRLVAIERSIRLVLDAEHPFVGDDVGTRWSWYKLPCTIGEEGGIFSLHGRLPVWIAKSRACERQDRGDGGRHGGARIAWVRLDDAGAPACHHGMSWWSRARGPRHRGCAWINANDVARVECRGRRERAVVCRRRVERWG